MASLTAETEPEPSENAIAERSQMAMESLIREIERMHGTVESRTTALLMRKATKTLLMYLHGKPTTAQQLFECLFCSPAIPPFDTLCFCEENWEDQDSIEDYGTFIRRDELQLRIYAYVVKRATAISLLEAEGTRVWMWDCATDPAFLKFVNAYTIPWGEGGDMVCAVSLLYGDELRTLDGYGRTLMLTPCQERLELRKAWQIFTQRPMKFVTKSVPFRDRRSQERGMKPVEVVVVYIKDVLPKGNFELEWEHMPAHRSRRLCPHTDYDFTYDL